MTKCRVVWFSVQVCFHCTGRNKHCQSGTARSKSDFICIRNFTNFDKISNIAVWNAALIHGSVSSVFYRWMQTLLTFTVHTDNDLNQKCQIWFHHFVRRVSQWFSVHFLCNVACHSIFSLFFFLTNSFLIALPPLRPRLMRLQQTTSRARCISQVMWQVFAGLFSYFLRIWLQNWVHLL